MIMCLAVLYGRAQAFAAHLFSAPPIFPPASVFVLPESAAGGKITVTPLSSQDLNSPIKPLTRTAYEIAHSTESYKVEIFRSSINAQSSFKYQITHLSSGYRVFDSISTPLLSKEYLYYAPGPSGYVVAAVVFRNIEFVTSVGSGGFPPTGEERLLSNFNVTLVTRAQAFAAHPFKAPPTTPIVTPTMKTRNGQLVALEKQIDQITKACADGFGITEYQMNLAAQGSIDVSMMEGDSQQTADDCNNALTNLNAISLPHSLTGYRIVHQLLDAETTLEADTYIMANSFYHYLQSGVTIDFKAATIAHDAIVNKARPTVRKLIAQITGEFGITP